MIPSDAMPNVGVSFPNRPISSYYYENFQVLTFPFWIPHLLKLPLSVTTAIELTTVG